MKNETLIKLGIAALGAALMGIGAMEPAHFPPVIVAWAPLLQKVAVAIGGVLEGWVLARRPGDIPPLRTTRARPIPPGVLVLCLALLTALGGCAHNSTVAKLREGCTGAEQLAAASDIATDLVCERAKGDDPDARQQCLQNAEVGVMSAAGAADLVCRAYAIAESRERAERD